MLRVAALCRPSSCSPSLAVMCGRADRSLSSNAGHAEQDSPGTGDMGVLARVRAGWAAFERDTLPKHPDTQAALLRRWNQLPARVRTKEQFLGKHTTGCEGTHGVFPACNFACTPCYHSKDSNFVRTDGDHTLQQVDKQMAYLRSERGPNAHAQLIGGEVTLLGPENHYRALEVMLRHERIPMSFSHGDFDYEYLEALCVDQASGRPRLKRLSFAGHFDSFMFGRTGIKRPDSEHALNPYRQRFVDHFHRLHREHGIPSYLAHNMTVTPRNLGQVAQMLRECKHMGFRLFAFQPAAFVGFKGRWKDRYRDVTADSVWAEIEKGIGARIPYKHLVFGDSRCNRQAWGILVGDRWIPLLDDREPRDLEWRDRFMRDVAGIEFWVPAHILAVKLLRLLARHPALLPYSVAWGLRVVRRAGGFSELWRHGAKALTIGMHNFMDAEHVAPAWELLKRGERSKDPKILETQERLEACSYSMSHPDTGELVPACVQHSVLDIEENKALRQLLPVAGAPAPRQRACEPAKAAAQS